MNDQDLKNQISTNITNLEEQIKLNESIELVKFNLTKSFELNVLKTDELYEDIKIIIRGLKVMLMRAIDMNDELNKKEATANIINKSITDLPIRFNKIIANFQDHKLFNKLKADLEKLTDELTQLMINLKVIQGEINGCLNDEKTQRTVNVSLNDQIKDLDFQLDELIGDLDQNEQMNIRFDEELNRAIEEKDRIQNFLVELNENLIQLVQDREQIKIELNEKLILFNQLKQEKQSLMNTFNEDRNLIDEIDKRKAELIKVQQQIEDVKNKSAAKSNLQIKIPRLKDEKASRQVKTLLIRLRNLIDLNFKDKYLD